MICIKYHLQLHECMCWCQVWRVLRFLQLRVRSSGQHPQGPCSWDTAQWWKRNTPKYAEGWLANLSVFVLIWITCHWLCPCGTRRASTCFKKSLKSNDLWLSEWCKKPAYPLKRQQVKKVSTSLSHFPAQAPPEIGSFGNEVALWAAEGALGWTGGKIIRLDGSGGCKNTWNMVRMSGRGECWGAGICFSGMRNDFGVILALLLREVLSASLPWAASGAMALRCWGSHGCAPVPLGTTTGLICAGLSKDNTETQEEI